MEISSELVIAGYVALAGGMAALYRSQLKSQSRCEANEIRMAKKIDELDRFQRTEMADYAERASTLAATAVPLLDRAMRVLRRHDPDHTPPPEGRLEVKRPSGETTSFLKAIK